MFKIANRLIIISLPILMVIACQRSPNPAAELVLLTPTATRTAAATRTITPSPPVVSATSQPSNTPAVPTSTPQEASPTPAIPDLRGVWDDNGHLIVIVQDGFNVSAAYIEERICDHADGTGAATPFRHDFNATLAQEGDVWILSGEEFTICAWGYADTSQNGVHWTSMKAIVSEDFKTITGDWYHSVEQRWVVDGVNIIRQFENGSPVSTPEGFNLPTTAP